MAKQHEPDQSKVQAAWIDLTVSVRQQLASRVDSMKSWAAEDCRTFVATLQEAMELEASAMVFDSSVERERQRLYCDSTE